MRRLVGDELGAPRDFTIVRSAPPRLHSGERPSACGRSAGG
jgi:hypothetical protein